MAPLAGAFVVGGYAGSIQRSYVLEPGRVVMNGDAGAMLNSENIQRAYLGLSAVP